MATKRTAAQALQDVRKMHRAVKLRESEDPAEVGQLLNVVLREVIAIREAAGGRIGKNAIKELRDLRSDMVAGHVDAGPNTGRMIAKYSVVLDELEGIETKQPKEGGGMQIPGNFSMANIVPSSESLISALITTNPVLGYTTKIARDFFSSMGERKKDDEERVKQALESAKAQAEMLDGESELLSQQLADDPNNQQLLAEQDLVNEKLEIIKNEIHELNTFLQDVWGDGNLEKIENNTTDTSETLERIQMTDEERAKAERDQLASDSLLQRESDFESNLGDDIPLGAIDGADGKLMGMLTGLKGLAGKILAPFVGILGFFFAGAKLLVGLKIGALLSVFSGIVGFFDGLFGASEILGKSDDDITLGERIQAAFSSMITGFLKPIDWVMKMFGMDGIIGDEMEFTRSIYAGIDNVIDAMKNFIMNPLETLKNFFDKGIEFVLGFLPEEWVSNYGDDIKAIASRIFDVFTMPLRLIGLAVDEIIEFIKDPAGYAKQVVDSVYEVIDKGIDFVSGIVESMFDSISQLFTFITDGITNFVEEKIGRVKNFFGIGNKESERELARYEEAEQREMESRLGMTEGMIETRENMRSEVANRILSGETGSSRSSPTANSPLFVHQNTNNVSNQTTVISGGSAFNTDLSIRRRQKESSNLTYAR